MSGGVRHFASSDEALAHEEALLDLVAGGATSFACSFWTTEQALVVPRAVERRRSFAAAAAASAERGWPVLMRRTGGGVSPQGPGLLNATVALATGPSPPSIALVYERFCAPIAGFLGEFGLAAATGAVPGSFCDGAFNVTVVGRKFAGTAQRWRRLGEGAGSAVLAHAVMLIDPPMADVVQAIQEFRAQVGEEGPILIDRHVTFAELRPLAAPGGLDLSDWMDGLAMAFRDSLRPLGPDPAGKTTADHAGPCLDPRCRSSDRVRAAAA